MASLLRRLPPIAVASFVLGIASGCSGRPTYPKEQLVESLRTLLAQDQLHLTAARLVDRTFAAQLDHPGTISDTQGQIGLGPAFDDAVRKAITTIHRVLMSTDARVEFYVLLITDPAVPGIYITLVRYLDDVRRAYWNSLSSTEMFARTIFDLHYVGSEPPTLEQYVPKEIQLEEFLSWQLARRIQSKLIESLEPSGGISVGRCGGEFRDGEFVFTLDVAPVANDTFDEDKIRTLLNTSTTVIAEVLSSYQFESFNAVRLIHPQTGRNLVLPKARLELFK